MLTGVVLTDPTDIRLLTALAEVGKVAVHELAAKLEMDPRDVAYRLVNLSAAGLPLLVGVESDSQGLRTTLAAASSQAPTRPAPPYPVHGTPSGPYPVHGTPSGRYPSPGSAQPAPSPQVPSPAPPQRAMTTWGPPQSALWARGDQQSAPGTPPAARHGRTGEVLETEGPEGERLAVQLLEVQDPADYLFAAGGYRLDEGERAVVVHTEVSNCGHIPFASLPDNYLELVTAEGKPVAKAPVSLTSRPPHKIGIPPGETSGGHTVYVLPEATSVVSVRWSPRPELDARTLTWEIDN